jgi:hypothetical protein
MKINALKIKLRKLHKYIGFTFSIFILHLTITGILLTYPATFKILDKHSNNFYVLKKYNMQTFLDVYQVSDTKNEIITINNSLYLNKKFIDSNKTNILGVIYNNVYKSLFVLNKEELIIYYLEEINNDLEINDILYLSNSESFTNIGKDNSNNMYIQNNNSLYQFNKDNSFTKINGIFNKNIDWAKTEVAKKDISNVYLKIHQGNGVSILKILTELHNGKFFGSIFTFILFISSLSLIFLTLSSFIFGTRLLKNKKNI